MQTIDAERFVTRAVPGCAAPDEFASESRERSACPAAAAQAKGSQHAPSDDGQRALVRSDINPGFPAMRERLGRLFLGNALCDVGFDHGSELCVFHRSVDAWAAVSFLRGTVSIVPSRAGYYGG
jgi:hypothetical protein